MDRTESESLVQRVTLATWWGDDGIEYRLTRGLDGQYFKEQRPTGARRWGSSCDGTVPANVIGKTLHEAREMVGQLAQDRIDADAKLAEMKVDMEELKRVKKLAVATNQRITRLLRNALPEAALEGAGVDGMVESVLALALRAKIQGV